MLWPSYGVRYLRHLVSPEVNIHLEEYLCEVRAELKLRRLFPAEFPKRMDFLEKICRYVGKLEHKLGTGTEERILTIPAKSQEQFINCYF